MRCFSVTVTTTSEVLGQWSESQELNRVCVCVCERGGGDIIFTIVCVQTLGGFTVRPLPAAEKAVAVFSVSCSIHTHTHTHSVCCAV